MQYNQKSCTIFDSKLPITLDSYRIDPFSLATGPSTLVNYVPFLRHTGRMYLARNLPTCSKLQPFLALKSLHAFLTAIELMMNSPDK